MLTDVQIQYINKELKRCSRNKWPKEMVDLLSNKDNLLQFAEFYNLCLKTPDLESFCQIYNQSFLTPDSWMYHNQQSYAYLAIKENNFVLFKRLLEEEYISNYVIIAAGYGRLDILKYLLHFNPNINVVIRAFAVAVKYEQINVVKFLIPIWTFDFNQYAVLACQQGSIPIVKLLIPKINNLYALYHIAVAQDNSEMANFLIAEMQL